MFTGIIQTLGKINTCHPLGAGVRLGVDVPDWTLKEVALGDSIAVDGVCLTVVQKQHAHFEVDVSKATLDGVVGWLVGGVVHLEKALRVGDPLGGHWVSGHVDGVGRVLEYRPVQESHLLWVEAPTALVRFVALKGSVTIHGVSLTINAVQGNKFAVNVIPHTHKKTTMGTWGVNTLVNLEVDLLARYAERFRQVDGLIDSEDNSRDTIN